MQNKKVTMLAAVLAVTIIAMAGVGYAAIAYKATTTNDNNSMDSTYIVLSQGGDAKYSGFLADLYFDTDTTWDETAEKDVSTYKPVFTGKLDTGAQKYTDKASVEGDLNAALISNVLTLTVKPTNNKDSEGVLTVTVANVSGSASTAPVFNPDLVYYMVISDSTNSVYKAVPFNETKKAWEITGVPLGITDDDIRTYTVQLVVILDGEKTTCATDSTGFAKTTETAKKTVFTFSLEASVAQP